MNKEMALGIQEETEPGKQLPQGSGEKPWSARGVLNRQLTGPRGEQMDMKGYLKNYEMLLEEAKVLDEQLLLRRNLLDGKPIPEGSGRYLPTDVMEIRKLLAQARIEREEAAQRLGITKNGLYRKLVGECKFKQWELTELAEMAKERLEAEWT